MPLDSAGNYIADLTSQNWADRIFNSGSNSDTNPKIASTVNMLSDIMGASNNDVYQPWASATLFPNNQKYLNFVTNNATTIILVALGIYTISLLKGKR